MTTPCMARSGRGVVLLGAFGCGDVVKVPLAASSLVARGTFATVTVAWGALGTLPSSPGRREGHLRDTASGPPHRIAESASLNVPKVPFATWLLPRQGALASAVQVGEYGTDAAVVVAAVGG